MSKANIRIATPRDAGAIAELVAQFDPDPANQRPSASMAQVLATLGTETVFVAEVGGVPSGFLTLEITHSVSCSLPIAEVTAIFDTGGHCRGGIEPRFMEAALRTAQKSHAMEIILRFNTANSAAIRFYERCRLNPADHLEYRVTLYGRNEP